MINNETFRHDRFYIGNKIKTNSGLDGRVVGNFHNQYGVRSMDIYLVDIKGEVEPWHKDSLIKIVEPKFKRGDIAYVAVKIENDMDSNGNYSISSPWTDYEPKDLIRKESICFSAEAIYE